MIKFIEDFINKTFRDEIIKIGKPREWRVKYRDVGERLEGYIVPVTYKYKGKQDEVFCIDNDHFCLVSADQARRNAFEFYYSNALKKIKHR